MTQVIIPSKYFVVMVSVQRQI